MSGDAGAAARLAELLDPALRGLGVRTRVREEQLRALLSDAVGPALAPMCRAVRLERGALLIATSNSALAHQLQLDSRRLLASLNAALGADTVHRLRFTAM
jgi:predicted nucleic acid-binding Zn ribbon protein